MARLSHSVSAELRLFSFWVANGTVGYPLLEGVDYSDLLSSEPSALEQVYAIWANVLEVDDEGKVLNAAYAGRRAAQYLRQYCDRTYTAEPPFEDWEVHLY